MKSEIIYIIYILYTGGISLYYISGKEDTREETNII